eukprot:TRINITY_DN7681_c0_g1_i1.p2 TRINITY_DN7681_c0_g1~~TRINITY_DN7681_c0_g1_i1.p2  ORF type:complete len:280 (+),score=104.69 TRINITY_DN7681_c0_g1_i1:1356-2195(+)
MSDNDLSRLEERLKALKVPPAKDDHRGRLDALKGPQIQAAPEDEIQARLAKLTGNNIKTEKPRASPVYIPKPQTEEEDVQDLLDQLSAGAAIEVDDDAIFQEYANASKNAPQPKNAKVAAKSVNTKLRFDGSSGNAMFDDEVAQLMDQVQAKVKRKQETGIDSEPEVYDSDEDPHNAGDIVKQAAIHAALAKKYGEKDDDPDEQSPAQPEPEPEQKTQIKKPSKKNKKKKHSSEEDDDEDDENSSDGSHEDGAVSKHQQTVSAAQKKANHLSAWFNKKK